MSEQSLVERSDNAVAAHRQSQAISIMDAVARAAADPQTDVDKMRVLLEMKREHEADEARKAFVAAMAAFRSDPPKIEKTIHVFYAPRQGPPVDYWHADIGAMSEQIGAAMAPHGLSFRWTTKQEGDLITVTCVVQHELGHSEETTLQATPDGSGGKNSIQAVGSAVQYLRRYTLESASGVVAQSGNFGDGAAQNPAPQTISEEQRANLQKRLEGCGADVALFCEYMRVGALSEITTGLWPRALKAVEAKERVQQAKQAEEQADG